MILIYMYRIGGLGLWNADSSPPVQTQAMLILLVLGTAIISFGSYISYNTASSNFNHFVVWLHHLVIEAVNKCCPLLSLSEAQKRPC